MRIVRHQPSSTWLPCITISLVHKYDLFFGQMQLKWNTGSLVKLSATQCYLPSDIKDSVELRMQRNVQNVPVETLGIEFAGQFITVTSPDEVNLACVLACAYHNLLVRENINDAQYGPYELTPVNSPRCTQQESIGDTDGNVSKFEVVSDTRRPRCKRQSNKTREKTDALTKQIVQGLEQWDEEVHGDQVVYDDTYEQNEDLVPWRMERRTDWAIEKYGYYY